MSLSERLKEIKGRSAIVRRVNLPASLKLETCYEQVSLKYDQVTPIQKTDYIALLAKLFLAAKAGEISKLSLREMRLSASCLFDGESKLADNSKFLGQFLDAQRSIRSRATVKRLIHAYFLHFDPKHSGIKQIGMFLRETVGSIPASSKWVWPERHRKFQLFDPTQATERVARVLVSSQNPRKELNELGLSGPLMVSGFSANAFLNVLHLTERSLMSNPRNGDVERIIAWIEADDGGIYYSAHRSAVANTFLRPWNLRDPDPALRQKIQTFLLEKLSDPRIDRGAWLGTDDTAREVMTRWLAKATLEQFLKVVDRVAAKHQWEYRRAFWNAYIGKGVVANAWVAFGSTGAQVARGIADATADSLMRRFATLAGANPDQAVLLLSIGDLVIADWSHNGRLRIWRRGNPSAPDFSQPSYIAVELRADSEFDTVHLPPDGWQSKAESYIRRHTGIKLQASEYLPTQAG